MRKDRVTVRQAAEMLDVSKTHVWNLVKKGKLTIQRTTPNKTKVLRESITALIEESNA